MLRLDDRAIRVHQRIFERIEQLPDIPRPVVGFEGKQCFMGEPHIVPLVALCQIAKQFVGEHGNVFLALAQRRNMERKHAQPVVEVFPESAALDH